MQDNEKKPALRFKGFTDPWEQRRHKNDNSGRLYNRATQRSDKHAVFIAISVITGVF